ncbi:HEPN domain-containing protein [Fervidibacter sacchari]|uniref:HEPN domain-containing protein/predicted nucleotidyltransferase n=1 Tax=Candidatus Fervidibacter sacchari TaxID=1448929 RepID=A0ABT2ENV8_9BACT|nr:HEPN domain-containing protein [Candidatus Fervidibacter sacchari]MCS3919374.1 HEPN domain-containing protein/predicted nucleotidyltransferase [Candidatus Fervidibacter sacchari]WKU15108.1 HEPN domain-containing protein [Candidatus Fervidibacter sacchari]
MALKLSELEVSLRKAIEPLVSALNPEFVLLFGSFAYGEPHKHGDVDLLIVLPKAPNPDGFSARLDLVMQHLAWSRDLPPYELHIMTIDEFRRELLKRNVFVAEIVRKGMPMFSRKDWDEVLREVETLTEQGELLYPLDWLRWARDDLWRVELFLAHDDVYDAAYHTQQAVEKALKAFLLAQGWQLERTHNLPYLLQLVTQYLPDLLAYEALCQRANQFIGARYPGVVTPPPTREELDNWLPQVRNLIEQVAQAI